MSEMVMTGLGVQKLDERAKLPVKAHFGDLGYDLFALEDVTLAPGEVTKVHTGIACEFPTGYGALIRDRSSMATKSEVFVVAGVIDQGYRGEIIVALYNPINHVDTQLDFWTQSNRTKISETKYIKAGDKIAQMILTPVVTFPVIEIDRLSETSRGTDGFGSTGR